MVQGTCHSSVSHLASEIRTLSPLLAFLHKRPKNNHAYKPKGIKVEEDPATEDPKHSAQGEADPKGPL